MTVDEQIPVAKNARPTKKAEEMPDKKFSMTHYAKTLKGHLSEFTSQRWRVKARFHYERGKKHSFSLLLIFD